MRIDSIISTADVLIQDVPGLFQLGCFRMTELSAESFLRNLGSDYILDVLTNYKDSCESEYNSLIGQICNLFLHLVQEYIYYAYKEVAQTVPFLDCTSCNVLECCRIW